MFEYKIVYGTLDQVEAEVNKFALEGWCLVGCAQHYQYYGSYFFQTMSRTSSQKPVRLPVESSG